jgi:hypothetical protein
MADFGPGWPAPRTAMSWLLIATALSAVTAVTASPVIKWAYGERNGYVLALVLLFTLPMLLMCLVAGWQVRRRSARPTFSWRPLAIATIALASAGLALALLGLLGALIAFAMVPVGVTLLAVAFVQPDAKDLGATYAVGAAIAPLTAWFSGRADEVLLEGIVSGAGLLACLTLLGYMRHNGTRAARS